MTHLLTIILAAGDGTRMKSSLPKVLHPVAGRPIVHHVAAAAYGAGASHVAAVISPDHKAVGASLAAQWPNIALFEQTERLGTADAARRARAAWEGFDGYIAVVFGDHPLLKSENFGLVLDRLDAGFDGAVLAFEPEDPSGYGRLITKGDALIDIREHKDASSPERAIGLCNACIIAFRAEVFRELIDQISDDNAQKEFYVGDLVPLANAAGYRVTYAVAPEEDVMGVNSRDQLARAETLFQDRLRQSAMRNGVTLQDPATTYFSFDTDIAADVTIEPGVYFGPGVTVETGAVIHAFSHISGAHVGAFAEVGPFARLRPGAALGQKAKAGNFTEIKNADIGAGAKINHLSYIGDADIGAATNVGAGTITCNYDGVNKYRTVIGSGVFVGSNSALVAPVSIGDGAYIGSGSVVTKDVPADDLAVGRARQENKPGYAKVLRARAQAAKAARQNAQEK